MPFVASSTTAERRQVREEGGEKDGDGDKLGRVEIKSQRDNRVHA